MTKINFWSPISAYYDCLPAPRSGVITANTPWSGAFDVAPTLWAAAHITQFAETGWRFLEGVGHKLPKGGSVVGFVHSNGSDRLDRPDLSLVVETTEAKGDQTLALKAAEGLRTAPWHVWRTDQMEQFIQQADLTASNGTWTITLDPNCIYSLTTTTGQRKGLPSSPPPGPFPLPYREDFEGYRVNATARSRKILAEGNTTPPGIDWHKIALRCSGDRIEARLDGKVIAALADSINRLGLAGLTSRFHPARFDNLILTLPPDE